MLIVSIWYWFSQHGFASLRELWTPHRLGPLWNETRYKNSLAIQCRLCRSHTLQGRWLLCPQWWLLIRCLTARKVIRLNVMSVFQRRFRVFIKSTKIDSYTSFCIVLIESILIRTSFFLKYFAEIKSKTKTDFFSYRKTLTPQLILYLWQTRTAQSQHDFSAILSASSVTTIASWFELYFRVNSFTVLLVRLEPIPCAFAVLKPTCAQFLWYTTIYPGSLWSYEIETWHL